MREAAGSNGGAEKSATLLPPPLRVSARRADRVDRDMTGAPCMIGAST